MSWWHKCHMGKMSGGTNVRWDKCHVGKMSGGTNVTFYNRWDKCHILYIGGTNVSFYVQVGQTSHFQLQVGQTSCLTIGGTNVLVAVAQTSWWHFSQWEKSRVIKFLSRSRLLLLKFQIAIPLTKWNQSTQYIQLVLKYIFIRSRKCNYSTK